MSFFLSLHTAILTVISFSIDNIELISPKWLILFPILGILIFCAAWWWLLKSYRDLNSAKYKVIGELEKELPKSPYWDLEWKELGEGNDVKKYLPVTTIEKWVPLIFGFLYICITIYIVLFQ